jgi:hypothetical protein
MPVQRHLKSPPRVRGYLFVEVWVLWRACISTNRVYVHEDIVDEFTDKLKRHIELTYSQYGRSSNVASGIRHGNSVNVGLGSFSQCDEIH